jgi:O-antigen ligase
MRLAVPGLLGTLRALFRDAGADPSVNSRKTDFAFISEFVEQRPIFGRGFGTFLPTRYDFLDNQYYLTLVEGGYVGLVMYIALLLGGMAVAQVIRRRAEHEHDRSLAQALTASLAVVAATSMAFDLLSFPSARSMLFVTLGCVGALWRLAPHREPVAAVRLAGVHEPRASGGASAEINGSAAQLQTMEPRRVELAGQRR